ncbi:ionotropic receptor 40a-like [Centruroides vittatus]|uniref:ionotropic receptor 40a-like n=1 Tax=Centruroides vittatus TaxID=120091 RepID=UPI0035103FE2
MKGNNLITIRESSARIPIGVWLLSVSVLGLGYSGTLISFLTAPMYEQVPTTLQQLADAVKNGEYSCGTIPDGQSMFFQGEKSPDIKILREHIEKNPDSLMIDPSAIVNKMKNERFAFISPEIFVKGRVMPLYEGTVSLSEENFITLIAAYFLKKGFPYKSSIDKIIIRLFETGIIQRVTEKEYLALQEYNKEVGPLKLEELTGSFVILFVGYLPDGIRMLDDDTTEFTGIGVTKVKPIEFVDLPIWLQDQVTTLKMAMFEENL